MREPAAPRIAKPDLGDELREVTSAHVVRFYERDDTLTGAVARFLGGGLGAGDAAVMIATGGHRADVERDLASRGLDLARLRADGRYVALDAAATLAQILVDGRPDAARFEAVVGGTVVAAAGDPPRRVFAFGEMVAVLWADGAREAALALERLWNRLAARQLLSVLCAYPIATFDRDGAAAPFLDVCGAHSAVVPAESWSALESTDERLRAVVEMQHKARVLDAEIARRKETEERLRERNDTLQALIAASPPPARMRDAPGPGVRVLIVEDSPDAAESLRMLLEVLGHRVRVAHDGPSGLESARTNPPDVMLVDIGLPGMDGYEVARRMRRDASPAGRVVLIALTGYGHDEDRRRALDAGFDHHLVKPVDPETLQGLVATLARGESGPAASTFH